MDPLKILGIAGLIIVVFFIGFISGSMINPEPNIEENLEDLKEEQIEKEPEKEKEEINQFDEIMKKIIDHKKEALIKYRRDCKDIWEDWPDKFYNNSKYTVLLICKDNKENDEVIGTIEIDSKTGITEFELIEREI